MSSLTLLVGRKSWLVTAACQKPLAAQCSVATRSTSSHFVTKLKTGKSNSHDAKWKRVFSNYSKNPDDDRGLRLRCRGVCALFYRIASTTATWMRGCKTVFSKKKNPKSSVNTHLDESPYFIILYTMWIKHRLAALVAIHCSKGIRNALFSPYSTNDCVLRVNRGPVC